MAGAQIVDNFHPYLQQYLITTTSYKNSPLYILVYLYIHPFCSSQLVISAAVYTDTVTYSLCCIMLLEAGQMMKYDVMYLPHHNTSISESTYRARNLGSGMSV